MASVSRKEDSLLKRANKQIANLKEDVRLLSNELRKKDALLSSFMDVASDQSKQITSLTAALHDTASWDPVADPRPSSCSTPNHQASWAEVVVRGRRKTPVQSASPSQLSLSNRFAVLREDPETAPTHHQAAAAPSLKPAPAVIPPLTAPSVGSEGEPSRPAGKLQVSSSSSSRSSTASARRKILLDAVLSRSSGLSWTKPAGLHSPVGGAKVSERPAVARSRNVDPARSSGNPPGSLPATPRPLFAPKTLIVGDSVIRNLRFFNATIHCLPGATVQVILEKLPGLLRSLPSSITRVIVHVGSNDTSRRTSELTKKDFNKLFSLLQSCGKEVFISGPIPTLGRGAARFSRILYLSTWLQSACRAHDTGFIDNFNLFWNRSSFFKADGLHPNRLGSRMLAANFQYAVQFATRA